jgi:hypothetical protein
LPLRGITGDVPIISLLFPLDLQSGFLYGRALKKQSLITYHLTPHLEKRRNSRG